MTTRTSTPKEKEVVLLLPSVGRPLRLPIVPTPRLEAMTRNNRNSHAAANLAILESAANDERLSPRKRRRFRDKARRMRLQRDICPDCESPRYRSDRSGCGFCPECGYEGCGGGRA